MSSAGSPSRPQRQVTTAAVRSRPGRPVSGTYGAWQRTRPGRTTARRKRRSARTRAWLSVLLLAAKAQRTRPRDAAVPRVDVGRCSCRTGNPERHPSDDGFAARGPGVIRPHDRACRLGCCRGAVAASIPASANASLIRVSRDIAPMRRPSTGRRSSRTPSRSGRRSSRPSGSAGWPAGVASNIGWATPAHSGATWSHGYLPGITGNVGGGRGGRGDRRLRNVPDARSVPHAVAWALGCRPARRAGGCRSSFIPRGDRLISGAEPRMNRAPLLSVVVDVVPVRPL